LCGLNPVREDTLKHMANYGMGGADGRGADDMQELVRNQKQNLEHDRRVLGIDAEQGRKPQVSAQLPRRCPFGRACRPMRVLLGCATPDA